MPNMTLTTEEEVLRWARIRAAEQNTSVARLVGELLKQRMVEERGYHSAKKRFLAFKPRVISDGGYPTRDALHDRAGLR